MENLGLYFLQSLTSLIPQLIVFSACIYYISKKKTIAGIFLIIGSVFGLLSSIFYGMLMPYMIAGNRLQIEFYDSSMMLVIRAIGFLMSMLFSIGLFLLIHNIVKKRTPNTIGLIDEGFN